MQSVTPSPGNPFSPASGTPPLRLPRLISRAFSQSAGRGPRGTPPAPAVCARRLRPPYFPSLVTPTFFSRRTFPPNSRLVCPPPTPRFHSRGNSYRKCNVSPTELPAAPFSTRLPGGLRFGRQQGPLATCRPKSGVVPDSPFSKTPHRDLTSSLSDCLQSMFRQSDRCPPCLPLPPLPRHRVPRGARGLSAPVSTSFQSSQGGIL